MSAQTVAGNGTYISGPFTALAAGTYRWVADYSGDATANRGVTTSCGDEIATVNPATPALSTTASPSVTVGGAIFDTATLTGGVMPTGTIVFDAYGPTDPECSNDLRSSPPPRPSPAAGPPPPDSFTPVARGDPAVGGRL